MSEKRLHIGCGKAYLPPEEGWTNVDIFSTVRADIYADMTSLPFERGSFDLIYASHVLEHCHRNMVVATLCHWRSLLKKDGILRIAVPDFGAVCEFYLQTQDLPSVMGLLYGGQNHPLNRHTTTFDEKYLTELLKKASFGSIEPWDWRKTDHSRFDDYSQAYLGGNGPMDKENGMCMSLNLQATR